MSRALLQIVLPLLLPTLLYVLWMVFVRKPGSKDGDGLAWVQHGPWLWLITAGVGLMAVALTVTALISGADPGGTYVPARIEGGRVVPGHIE